MKLALFLEDDPARVVAFRQVLPGLGVSGDGPATMNGETQ
jgi:hypothetical protein